MGVKPSQVADLLALKGDSIDNIPGAPGIGDKGATDLIARFGSVEAALDRAAEVERKMYRESLLNNREQILLSKQLATIHTQVPVEWDLATLRAQLTNNSALESLYKELEFFSLLKDLPPEDDSATRDYADPCGTRQICCMACSTTRRMPAGSCARSDKRLLGLLLSQLAGRAIPIALLEAHPARSRIRDDSQNCSRCQSASLRSLRSASNRGMWRKM